MPVVSENVCSFLKSDDFRRACLASLIPGVGAVVAYTVFTTDKEALKWWNQDLKKPDWAPKDVRLYTAIDTLTLLPVGCASFLVHKHGGGFENGKTALALGAYGINIALATLSVPLMLKTKSSKVAVGMSLGIHISANVVVGLFWKVYRNAGLMVLPYALWSGFYLLLFTHICQSEREREAKE